MYISLLGIIACKDTYKIIGKEQDYGNDRGHGQSHSAYYCPQRGGHKEDDDAGKGKGKFFMKGENVQVINFISFPQFLFFALNGVQNISNRVLGGVKKLQRLQ